MRWGFFRPFSKIFTSIAVLTSIAASLSGCMGLDKLSNAVSEFSLSKDTSGLTGVQAYAQTVYPIVRAQCTACHSGGSNPAFAQSDVNLAYPIAKARANFTSPADSILVRKVMDTHCGVNCSTNGKAMTDAVADWAHLEKVAPPPPPEESAGTLGRSAPEVLSLRLKTIFPNIDENLLILNGDGLGKNLGQGDSFTRLGSSRPSSAVAMVALRSTFAAKCIPGETVLFSTNGILLNGESLPTDPATKLAFAAARNGWLYPYAADSAEVRGLLKLYQDARAAGSMDIEAQKGICIATLLAPQFWLGNSGPLDWVRRYALELGRRVPTFDEFSRAKSGSLTAQSFVRSLMTEAGFIKAAKSWHSDWWKTLSFTRAWSNDRDPRPDKYHGGDDTASGAADNWADVKTISGLETLQIYDQANDTAVDSEYCQPGLLQPFEPRSDQVRWVHWNRRSNAWEVMGGFRLNGGIWEMFSGTLTKNDGTQVTVTLDDLGPVNRQSDQKYYYPSNKMVSGTPIDGFAAGERRVIRSYQGTDQTGYSAVKLYWSGAPVYACNNVTRFIATCSYRPISSLIQINRFGGIYPFIGDYGNGKRHDPKVPQIIHGQIDKGTKQKDSYAHPLILDSFSCGQSVPDAATEAQAYPKSGPFPDVAINISVRDVDNTNGRKELAEFKAISEDLSSEPYRLLEGILTGNGDYREILTANYTYGRGSLELLFRTQGWWLPTFPTGTSRTPGGSNYSSVMKIDQRTIAAFSKQWMKNSYGSYTDNWDVLDSIQPRPMSGVLTQAGFLGPASTKMRTVAARIFKTFTCGEMSLYKPTGGAAALHEAFIPTREKGGSQHVDKTQNCYSCHVNLDPLAAALSTGYLDLKSTGFAPPFDKAEALAAKGGILGYWVGDTDEHFTYGIRGGNATSAGALMGQSVHTVQEVGTVLANSPEFAKCAAYRTFEGLYGHAPTTKGEQALIDRASSILTGVGGYRYSALVETLALDPLYLESN